MKTGFATLFCLSLTLIFLAQMTLPSYGQDSVKKASIETPWEEAGDEDSKTKDTDNEEDDKTFYSKEDKSDYSFTVLSHLTDYQINHTEQLREIISPPPKG
jgi:hypothetical protein